MNHILKDLILFHQDQLSASRRKEVLTLLESNPAFKDALLGIAFVEEELAENDTIDNFLTNKKAAQKSRIFATKSPLSE